MPALSPWSRGDVGSFVPGDDTPALVRTAICTDVALYREALTRWLTAASGISMVGSAASLDEVLQLVHREHPSVLVIDMATHGATQVVQGVRAAAPAVKQVAFGVSEGEEALLRCCEAGVSGFVPRDASADKLASGVQSAARGELLLSPRAAAFLFERLGSLSRGQHPGPPPPVPFSEREQQIGQLLVEGLANKELAVRLRIEVATVKNHIHRILAKLRVRSRSEAAAYFRALARPPSH